jgi:hypothetical protein
VNVRLEVLVIAECDGTEQALAGLRAALIETGHPVADIRIRIITDGSSADDVPDRREDSVYRGGKTDWFDAGHVLESLS